jgi:hypothetical protein
MPATLQERMIRLWASPQGAPKAALAGVTDPPVLGANPSAIVPEGVATAGKTSVVWETGRPVVTFPIPGVPGAIAIATLDAKYMAERVVVKQGSTTTEFIYSDYQDWNNPLNKAEAFYPGKITERRNGAVVRDLTTVETETGQVYVVMPVPASVRAANTPTAQPPAWTQPKLADNGAQNQPTPRLANGKPDMTGTGMWLLRIQLVVMGTAGVVRRNRPTATRDTTSQWTTNSIHLPDMARAGPRINPSFGTRCSSSTCGRTRKIPS